MKYTPTFENVYKIARQSECVRRKYGVRIVDDQSKGNNIVWHFIDGYNKRIGKCCEGTDCIRNRLDFKHGSNTDAGAEIHAEQAALLNSKERMGQGEVYLAGLDAKDNPLIGRENAPCYSCARMLRYAGYRYVFLPKADFSGWEPTSIAEIMETWEQTWETGE